jgi:hypothetical protein
VEKKSSSMGPVAIIILIVLVFVCIGGVGSIGIFAAIAIPNFVTMQYRAKRAELPANIDGIKIAELAYEAAFDTYVAQPQPVPRSIEDLGGEPMDWGSGAGFDTLGWAPDGPVRGTYWIEVTPGGDDFVVHGMADLDGDGVPSHYTATKSTYAVMISPPNVY